MKEHLTKFAQWLDDQSGNPAVKFASAEEALQRYFDIERPTEIDKITKMLRDQKVSSSIKINNNVDFDALSIEIVTKAMADKAGEIAYIAYAPHQSEGCVIDIGIKDDGRLAGALYEYAITHGKINMVSKFIHSMNRILWYAQVMINKELQKRTSQN